MDTSANRYTSVEMRAVVDGGGVPDGIWRVGARCHRQVHIDRPDGGTVDIGRFDTPALAAHAVDAADRYRAALQAIADFTPQDDAEGLAGIAHAALDGDRP